jgi:Fe-S oxidoreductase
MMDDFDKVIETTGVFNCMDCGKCTSVCPISWRDNRFSPRKTVLTAVHQGPEALIDSGLTWNCLTCNMCTIRCPMGVEFIDFVRDIRARAYPRGNQGRCTHDHTIRTWGEMMAHDGVNPERLDWLAGDMSVSEEGEIGYFVGCLPFYSRFFVDLAADAVDTARSTVRLFNLAGIEPVVMSDEVCCGHDFLWSGDRKTFASLAARNMEAIRRRGIRRIVTACAECYRTLKADYPWGEMDLSIEVSHASEFFLEKIEEGALSIPRAEGDGEEEITYHDPCRLSKHMGVMEAPRKILGYMKGVELVEMQRSGIRSVCCGTSIWMNCSWISKDMQVDRLREAIGTGAGRLLTSCPKCIIHFRCAMAEEDGKSDTRIEVGDLITFLAGSMRGAIEFSNREER